MPADALAGAGGDRRRWWGDALPPGDLVADRLGRDGSG